MRLSVHKPFFLEKLRIHRVDDFVKADIQAKKREIRKEFGGFALVFSDLILSKHFSIHNAPSTGSLPVL